MKSGSQDLREAMQMFLKQSALEKSRAVAYVQKDLGLNATTAKRVAEEMALAGYLGPS